MAEAALVPGFFGPYVKGVLFRLGHSDVEMQPEALAELYAAFTAYGQAVLDDATETHRILSPGNASPLDLKKIRLAARLHGSIH